MSILILSDMAVHFLMLVDISMAYSQHLPNSKALFLYTLCHDVMADEKIAIRPLRFVGEIDLSFERAKASFSVAFC